MLPNSVDKMLKIFIFNFRPFLFHFNIISLIMSLQILEKLFLSNILRSYIPEYDHGIVQSVQGYPSVFWLHDLVVKSIYLCEELCLSTKEIIQRFKGVMEGNSSQFKKLYRRPFIIVLNILSIFILVLYYRFYSRHNCFL